MEKLLIDALKDVRELDGLLNGLKLKTYKLETGLKVSFDGQEIAVGYSGNNTFFRALALAKERGFNKPFEISQSCKFEYLGLMIDCSRNAVLNAETVKLWIRKMALMGYNRLMLYTEDTYEVDNQPYFGYKRGRFSQEELKSFDEYGQKFGIELVPCIQTLAHLNGITTWHEYKQIIDCGDILLVDDERTYKLIEDMVATSAKCFKSPYIHIGMDEAHMLGRGKFLDIHGYEKSFDIICRHLNKVIEITNKYNLKPMMWSDMFFRLQLDGGYYTKEIMDIPKEILDKVPSEVELVYWDYYGTDSDKYNAMFLNHKQFKNNISFAGGAWTWSGLAPLNNYSIDCTKVALENCEKHGIKDMMLTLWGDDGGECPSLSLLPSIAYTAEYAYGSLDLLKGMFKAVNGCSYDDFMLLDLPNRILTDEVSNVNTSKYMLYNDYFLGLLNSAIKTGGAQEYAKHAQTIAAASKRAGEWSYLFDTMSALCKVLSYKYDLSAKTYEAYRNKDKKQLLSLVKNEYANCVIELENLYTAFRKQWKKVNKSYGFEIQDIRLGGLIMRTKHCIDALNDYIEGRTKNIDELDEQYLNYQNSDNKEVALNSFRGSYSANILGW